MKKILSIAIVTTIGLLLISGCKSINEDAKPSSLDAKVSNEALYVNTHDNKKTLHAIKVAGENTGWKITEFKRNEVIAEKTINDNTVSSSVIFSDGHIEFSNPEVTSELRDAIEQECQNTQELH